MGVDLLETRSDDHSFLVQIQFQQNATWQGTITWVDQNKCQRFRSTLEMIKLMDSALASGESDDLNSWT